MSKQVRTWAYIAAVVVASTSIVGITATVWPLSESSTPIWMLLLLTGLVTLAGRFPIPLSRQADASLRVVPMFMAVLLVQPAEAALVGAAGAILSEVLLRTPVRAVLFNSGVDTFATGVAAIVFISLRPEAAVLSLTAGQMLAAGAAGMTILTLNLVLVDIMAIVRRGWEYLNHWKFNYYLVEAPQELGFLTIGLIGALLATQAAWGPVVVIIPAVLTYFGFKFVVSEAAEKTRLAEELQASLKELTEVQAQLITSAKMASVGTLATGIAHEINNPVFAITGRADLLIKGADKHLASEKALEYVHNVKDMATRISKITTHLLEYAQPDEDMKEVILSEVMESAVTLMGKNSKSVRIIREYEDAPIVMGVQSQLQQIFVNLLSNSVEAVPDWGCLTLGCKIENDTAVAYVKDDGVGMSAELLGRIFEPFVGSKDINNRVGLGLGLYTCHKIVNTHGGEITIDSKSGKGTMVTIKLPLHGTADVPGDDVDVDDPDMPMAVGMQD
ncbi:MAG: HAMP domain-containing histidine kinase [Chloroflexi bacterium]|nr:HAMP domain-containing histidine kinase [Chloroflexota bacterium]